MSDLSRLDSAESATLRWLATTLEDGKRLVLEHEIEEHLRGIGATDRRVRIYSVLETLGAVNRWETPLPPILADLYKRGNNPAIQKGTREDAAFQNYHRTRQSGWMIDGRAALLARQLPPIPTEEQSAVSILADYVAEQFRDGNLFVPYMKLRAAVVNSVGCDDSKANELTDKAMNELYRRGLVTPKIDPSRRGTWPIDWRILPAAVATPQPTPTDPTATPPTTSATPKAGDTRTAKRDKKTEARDKWIYQRCCAGVPHDKIAAELKRKAPAKGWKIITTKNRVWQIGKEYAERNGLAPHRPVKDCDE